MSEKILLATSIAPRSRIETQKTSLESWKENGFDVVSFNTPDEIRILNKDFPTTQFVPLHRTGELFAGKPLPFIADILHYLKLSKQRYCGIINSDIYFSSPKPLNDMITEHIENSFVYGARFQVNELQSEEGDYDPYGFDYFIFDQSLESNWDENHFCMGMPFWDHWFPLIPILNGHCTKKIISPIARHENHPTSWGNETLAFNDEFVRILIDYQTRNLDWNKAQKVEGVLADFKAIEIQRPYYEIKAKMQEQSDQSVGNPDTYACLEELANLFDRVTRDILKFLETNSESISI